jgi:protein MpaA
MPLVRDVGYPTPGSFGSWAADRRLPAITYEFPLAATEVLMRDHVPVLVGLLTGTGG